MWMRNNRAYLSLEQYELWEKLEDKERQSEPFRSLGDILSFMEFNLNVSLSNNYETRP